MSLSVKQAARLKGVSIKTVYYWIKSGKLPTASGKIKQSDLDNFKNHRKSRIDRDAIRKQLLKADLSSLTNRQREIITLLYGLENGRCKTIGEVAGQLGVSRAIISKVDRLVRARCDL